MTSLKGKVPQLSRHGGMGLAAAALLALGAAGGAGAMAITRPAVEMAPVVNTPIAKLTATAGIVTVRGKIVEVFGDRFVIQDQSGRTMVDAGRAAGISVGQGVIVQGRFDKGQLHASYLVQPNGKVTAIGPPGGPPHGPGHGRPDGHRPHPGEPERADAAPGPDGCEVPGARTEQPAAAPGAANAPIASAR